MDPLGDRLRPVKLLLFLVRTRSVALTSGFKENAGIKILGQVFFLFPAIDIFCPVSSLFSLECFWLFYLVFKFSAMPRSNGIPIFWPLAIRVFVLVKPLAAPVMTASTSRSRLDPFFASTIKSSFNQAFNSLNSPSPRLHQPLTTRLMSRAASLRDVIILAVARVT